MRAVRIVEHHEGRWPIVMLDDPWPKAPGPGEVEIRVHAAGVNRPDVLHRQGRYLYKQTCKPYLGLEPAGVISRVREGVSHFKEGDRVCALLDGHGYSEAVVCDARLVLPIPAPLSFVEAAAIPEAFATAWLGLIGRAAIRDGETAIIHAAASGVGVAALQLLKHRGHRVFVTSRKQARIDRLIRECGADAGATPPFLDAVRRWSAPLEKVNVILDCVGRDYLEANVQCLAPRGRLIIIIGLLSGREAMLDLGRVLAKQLRIESIAVRLLHPDERADVIQGLARDVWPIFESGVTRPVIDMVYPLEEAEKAHQRLDDESHFGKVVLSVVPDGSNSPAGG